MKVFTVESNFYESAQIEDETALAAVEKYCEDKGIEKELADFGVFFGAVNVFVSDPNGGKTDFYVDRKQDCSGLDIGEIKRPA
ncbi:hypothetical protein [uncultured Bartonella sp.]|uniref:hypothetical protein n=1 Tax=uncultured Bartonella sp. TaxID=104108 RepID=UPI0025E25B66|nr:hypothetical protein [uncultured Bartonella sp.]